MGRQDKATQEVSKSCVCLMMPAAGGWVCEEALASLTSIVGTLEALAKGSGYIMQSSGFSLLPVVSRRVTVYSHNTTQVW